LSGTDRCRPLRAAASVKFLVTLLMLDLPEFSIC
jgi:hypothetical protein